MGRRRWRGATLVCLEGAVVGRHLHPSVPQFKHRAAAVLEVWGTRQVGVRRGGVRKPVVREVPGRDLDAERNQGGRGIEHPEWEFRGLVVYRAVTCKRVERRIE